MKFILIIDNFLFFFLILHHIILFFITNCSFDNYLNIQTTTIQPTPQHNENSTSFVCTRLLNEGGNIINFFKIWKIRIITLRAIL